MIPIVDPHSRQIYTIVSWYDANHTSTYCLTENIEQKLKLRLAPLNRCNFPRSSCDSDLTL